MNIAIICHQDGRGFEFENLEIPESTEVVVPVAISDEIDKYYTGYEIKKIEPTQIFDADKGELTIDGNVYKAVKIDIWRDNG